MPQTFVSLETERLVKYCISDVKRFPPLQKKVKTFSAK